MLFARIAYHRGYVSRGVVKPQVPISHCQGTAWQTLGSQLLKTQEARAPSTEKNVNITTQDI